MPVRSRSPAPAETLAAQGFSCAHGRPMVVKCGSCVPSCDVCTARPRRDQPGKLARQHGRGQPSRALRSTGLPTHAGRRRRPGFHGHGVGARARGVRLGTHNALRALCGCGQVRHSRSRGLSRLGVKSCGVEGHLAGDLRLSGEVPAGAETGSVIAGRDFGAGSGRPVSVGAIVKG